MKTLTILKQEENINSLVLPELIGTKKQRETGEKIRARWVEIYESINTFDELSEVQKELHKKKLFKILKSVISSTFYINKANYKKKGILEYSLDYNIEWVKINGEDTEKNCAVYFFERADGFLLQYEGIKTDEIVDMFHQLNFSWNRKAFIWEKSFEEIKEAENIFEILCKSLLNNGFSLNVFEECIEKYNFLNIKKL